MTISTTLKPLFGAIFAVFTVEHSLLQPMRIIKILIPLVFLLSTGSISAQKKIIEKGDKHFANLNYPQALEYYKQAFNKRKKKKNPELFKRLADTYRIQRDWGKAEFYYEKALQYSRKDDADMILNYVHSLMNNQKHSFALSWLDKYHELRPSDTRIDRMMDWCMDYDVLSQGEEGYQMMPVPFNSTGSDFSPVYYKDQLIFSSSRNDPFAGKDDRTGESFVQLYSVEETNGVWSRVTKLPGRVRTKFNEGTASFSPDGREMFYTRNEVQRDYGNGKVAVLKMYRAVMDKSSWVEIEELPFNASEQASYSVGQPTVSADGKFLFFTSDMPGGFGGKDLYVVERYGLTRWSKPVNLGPNVNTEGDEMFPFIHADGSLYFSTNGHGGFGGLDVFYSAQINGEWVNAKNAGLPINSSKDDFGIVFDEKKNYGFISSNRYGGMGGDDIYQFKNLNPNRNTLVNKQLVSTGDNGGNFVSEDELGYNAPEYDFDEEAESSMDDSKSLTAVLIGQVLDSTGNNPIANAEVEMEDLVTGSKEVYFTEIDGHFYFQLEMGSEYRLRYKENRMVYDEQIIMAEGSDQKIVNVELRKNGDGFLLEEEEPIIAMEEVLQPRVTVDTFSFSSPEVIRDTFRTEQKSYARTYKDDMDSTAKNDVLYQKLTFKVQIGAFRAASPPSDNYLAKAKDIVEKEHTNTGFIRFVTKSAFSDLYEAENYLEYIIKTLGYGDSYVVPYLNGSRLDMNPEEAIQYVK